MQLLMRFVFAFGYLALHNLNSNSHFSCSVLPIIVTLLLLLLLLLFRCTTRRIRVGRSRVHVELPPPLPQPRPATKNTLGPHTHRSEWEKTTQVGSEREARLKGALRPYLLTSELSLSHTLPSSTEREIELAIPKNELAAFSFAWKALQVSEKPTFSAVLRL